jgi:hypothetical protein
VKEVAEGAGEDAIRECGGGDDERDGAVHTETLFFRLSGF